MPTPQDPVLEAIKRWCRRPVNLALIAVCVAQPLSAANEVSWGEAGEWETFVDPDNGNGCFARKTFEDGLIVEIGAVPDQEGGFFAVHRPEWTHIEAGTTGTINFDFGDAKFAGDVLGVTKYGVPGGYAFFDNPEFVKEFDKRYSVTALGETGTSTEIDLAGSALAVQDILECQAGQAEPAG